MNSMIKRWVFANLREKVSGTSIESTFERFKLNNGFLFINNLLINKLYDNNLYNNNVYINNLYSNDLVTNNLFTNKVGL